MSEALDNKWLNGNSYRATSVPAMLDALARYAEGFPGTGRDDLKALERFSWMA